MESVGEIITKKNGRGGYRPGAGRRAGSKGKKTIAREQAGDYLKQSFLEEWQEIIETKRRLALGDYYIERTKDGQKVVYKAAPDNKALEEIIDRVIGKNPEKLEADMDIKGKIESNSMLQMANAIKAVAEMRK